HLHQRQDAFLHAGPAGRGEDDEGRFLLDRELHAANDSFAGGHAERTAHEIEILHGDDDGGPLELAVADLDRIIQVCAGPRIPDAIGVALLVTEFQGIGGHFRQGDVVPGLVIEDRLQPRQRADAHVIIGAGDHHLVGLDVLVKHELPGVRALDPQILRRLTTQHVADFRPNDVGEPIHVLLRLKRDEFRLNRHRALAPCLGMIFSENRFTLFQIMPQQSSPTTKSIWRLRSGPASRRFAPISTLNLSYSAACFFALRTPCASKAARSATALTVFAVAWPSESRLSRNASTSAVPTTAPLARSAMAHAASGVRMPKPTHTGSLVCRLMRATASPTTFELAAAAPVMPVIETY